MEKVMAGDLKIEVEIHGLDEVRERIRKEKTNCRGFSIPIMVAGRCVATLRVFIVRLWGVGIWLTNDGQCTEVGFLWPSAKVGCI